MSLSSNPQAELAAIRRRAARSRTATGVITAVFAVLAIAYVALTAIMLGGI